MKNIEYLLFKYIDVSINQNIPIDNYYKVELFLPSLLNLKKHKGKISIYLFWYIFTIGRYKIVYLYKDTKIVHYSHIIPKFFKFPFMKFNDLEIGPSWTDKNFRGQRFFPFVIDYIVEYFREKDRDFYILVHTDNKASLNSIKKTNFELYSKVYKTSILGIYKR